MLPKGTRGSVSHKKTWAIAWAGKALDEWQWGIDLEEIAKTRFDIAPRILTGAELYALRHLPEMERTRGVMFRFSAKEALYKALDAIVHRYVGFQEVEVDILPEGQAQARFFLKENPFECELTWRELDSHVVTFAKVRKPLSSGAL